MIYHKLVLSITFIAFLLVQADAQPFMLMNVQSLGFAGDSGDPLDPSQLGESMSMPLPQELIQEAEEAEVITKSNPLYKSDSQPPSFKVVPLSEVDADASVDNVNVTGAWSFDLKGKSPEQMNLYLIQKKDVITGQGFINRLNGKEKATASGSISGDKMSLTVMPVGVSNLYKLNLSLSSLDAGIYTIDMADGSSWSGKVTFAVSSNIFVAAEDELGAYSTANLAPATSTQEKTADDWYKKGREQLGKTPLEGVINSYDKA